MINLVSWMQKTILDISILKQLAKEQRYQK